MKFSDKVNNALFNTNRYRNCSEAVIIACYFNPQKNPYRLKAFKAFYETIRHLEHRIIECVIGDAKPELEESEFISNIQTPNLLWHKETLLNILINELPAKYKFIFWLDTDVRFTNNKWLLESVEVLKKGKKHHATI